MRAYPGRLRQRLRQRPPEQHVVGELEGEAATKDLQETPSLHVRHAAKFAFRGAQRSSETLFGDGMAVDEIFDPRFLSSDARSY